MLNVVIKPFRPQRVGDLYASEDEGALFKLERMGLILRLEREKVLEALGVQEGESQDALKAELVALKLERDTLKATLETGAKSYDALQAHAAEGVKLLAEVESARAELELENAGLKAHFEKLIETRDPALESHPVDTALEGTGMADPAPPTDSAPDTPKRPSKGK